MVNIKFLLILSCMAGLSVVSSSYLQFDELSSLTKKGKIDKAIDKLLKSVLEEQSKKDKNFRNFPQQWAEIKGIFKSYIHLNISGAKNNFSHYLLREKLKCLDMNVFVTNFVLTVFLESSELGSIELPHKSFIKAFEGMLQFKDKNYPDSPIYTFWRQKKFQDWWSQHPDTMVGLLENKPNTEWLIKLLNFVGLHSAADFLKMFNGLWDMFSYAYKIPSDLDDSYTALALTSYMRSFNNTSFETNWISKNENIEELFKVTKEVAYRPFDGKDTANPLDPRTYFWLHDFLMYSKEKNPDRKIALPTTWMWNWEKESISYQWVNLPFHTNNIDLNVLSNFFYGIANLVVFHPNKEYVNNLFDEDFSHIVEDVGSLLNYVVEHNTVNKRPDITVLYYPSVWDFYWMISRASNLIRNKIEIKETKTQIEKILSDINSQLKYVLKSDAMTFVKTQVKEKGNDQAYVTEFLGNYAKKSRNEDALFSTSLTLNTLINVWTETKNNKVFWIKETTDEAKTLINKMANFVINSSLNNRVSREGAFFSGSVHSNYSSLPFFYPANNFKFLNGTDFIPSFETLTDTASYGINKYIENDEFTKQRNETHFGQKVPETPDDISDSTFPFWSSPALTESVALLGLSKYQSLSKSGEISLE